MPGGLALDRVHARLIYTAEVSGFKSCFPKNNHGCYPVEDESDLRFNFSHEKLYPGW